MQMKRKDAIIVAIIAGTIVAIITVFVLTPLGDWIYDNENNAQSDSIIEIAPPKEDTYKDTLTKLIVSKKPNNIYYLQSYRPIELFDGDLILTLNKSIEYVNQNIELKIVEKSSRSTEITKDTRIGDVYFFNEYIISFISLERNISTYDLKLKIERKDASINKN